jgi:hypothetical protein
LTTGTFFDPSVLYQLYHLCRGHGGTHGEDRHACVCVCVCVCVGGCGCARVWAGGQVVVVAGTGVCARARPHLPSCVSCTASLHAWHASSR